MKLVTRAQWGARYGRGPTNITPQSGGVAVHYVGAGTLTKVAHDRCTSRVREIEAYHVNGNGWAGIAYNFLACHHGYVFEGRGLGRRSAAQGTNSGNQNYYAVCALIGDGDTKPDDTLKGAIRDAIDYMQNRGAGKKIKGHRDFHSTSCPGGPLYKWVQAGAPRPGGVEPAPTPPPQPGTTAPAYPLRSGHWFGPESNDPRNHSGFWPADRPHIAKLRDRLRERGWDVAAGERYDEALAAVVKKFQAEKRISADGLTGPATWRALWEAPIT